jgi:hypothetical protein
VPPHGPAHRKGLICRDGTGWLVAVGHRRARVVDLVGMRHLAELLTRPGQGISALTLVSGSSAPREQDRHELLDDTARTAYAARARDLRADLDEAEAHNDIGRRERLHVELDAMVDELAAAAGLGGRPRAFTDSTERARSAVRKAIKRAIDAIDEGSPAIAGLLRATVRTGLTCVYQPDLHSPVAWTTRSPAAEGPASAEEWEPAELAGAALGLAARLLQAAAGAIAAGPLTPPDLSADPVNAGERRLLATVWLLDEASASLAEAAADLAPWDHDWTADLAVLAAPPGRP